jgi:WD40 repeat protein
MTICFLSLQLPFIFKDKWLATSSADATVKVYSFPNDELLANLTDHTKEVTAVALNPTEIKLMS